jgi:hypothetical protein
MIKLSGTGYHIFFLDNFSHWVLGQYGYRHNENLQFYADCKQSEHKICWEYKCFLKNNKAIKIILIGQNFLGIILLQRYVNIF